MINPDREIIPIRDVALDVMAYHDAAGDLIGIYTGIPGSERYWRIEKGTLVVLTGIPGSGKSEIVDQIAVETIRRDGWRWLFLSPENMPLRKHAAKIVEKSLGMPFGNHAGFRMTADDAYAECMRLGDSIRMMNPHEDSTIDLEWILARLRQAWDEGPFDAMVIDPWSEMEWQRPHGMSEHEYTGQTLTILRRWARSKEVLLIVVAHPTKLHKGEDDNYPVPTPYDISGSSHWRNKPDVCLCVWRDYNNKTGAVDLHVQKMRNRLAGELAKIQLSWSRVTGRYYGSEADKLDAERQAALRHDYQEEL